MDSIFERFCAGNPVPHLSAAEILDSTRPISRGEQLNRFGSAAFALYWQAERVRKQAISWRNFCVGCATWAYREDASTPGDRWQAFCGMNTKPVEGGRNICAEPVPLNFALSRCYTKIVGMVVVGVPREEDSTLTLHPCEHCRVLMLHHPLIGPDTYIITAHPPPEGFEIETLDQITHEVFTFEELLKFHGEA